MRWAGREGEGWGWGQGPTEAEEAGDGGRLGRGPCEVRGGSAVLRVMTTTLQDVRLLAAGKVPQRAGEVERDLDKADSMIRLLFNDVQTLKDGRHPQGEQMYRRWAPPCPP